MQKNTFTLILLCLATTMWSQSTALRVYDILQEKCASCHNGSSAAAQLDLVGSGNSLNDRAASVYQTLINATPQDAGARTAGYAHIYPGRTDLSLLFHQINRDLDAFVAAQDKSSAHPTLPEAMTDIEKEMIRQWIVYGAPATGKVVEEAVITDFYTNHGLKSHPQGPPPAPDPSEGFQVKVGPFFLEPGGEDEYFTKYELDLPDDVEVNRLDVKIGTYSHHFIVYDFDNQQAAASVKAGLRDDNEHADIGFVATVAESRNIQLPPKTAFFWKKNAVLDLNPHYINYSADMPYQAEVYMNVYTQEKGTAVQEMRSTLIPNFNIYIPNDGDEVTFTRNVVFPAEFYLWQIGGHTHKYGQDYKVWKRTPQGGKGDMIYNGSCPRGEPTCDVPYFDYQHIPNRTFDDWMHVNLNVGLVHEATYINDGPSPVSWGPTSDDEMMLFAIMYVTDVTGLEGTTNMADYQDVSEQIELFPNPMTTEATVVLPKDFGTTQFSLFDALGQEVKALKDIETSSFSFNRNSLSAGIYWYRVENEKGEIGTGKVVLK